MTDAAAVLLARLAGEGFASLAAKPAADLERAWTDTVASLRDARSREGRALRDALLPGAHLTVPGLDAALEVMLAGVGPEVARTVFTRARARSAASPALVVLAASPVGLAVQPLLPALARRRPLVFKCARDEPRFAPFLLDALAAREPAIGRAYAARSWAGGQDEIENALAERVDRIVVYGGARSVRSWTARFGERVVPQGPKSSLAVVGEAASAHDRLFDGLARDVALFEQQGCLSLQWVLVRGDAERFAARLARSLARLAETLPAPPLDPARALAIQQLRAEAEMRGLWTTDPGLGAPGRAGRPAGGHVIHGGRLGEASALDLRPSPGGRCVLVWQIADLDRALSCLAPMRGVLQGAVVEGFEAAARARLTAALEELGVTRLAPAGTLQMVDALWPNGGVDPLELY